MGAQQTRLKFFHIPKTAGTSIENAARDKCIEWGVYDLSYWHRWKTPGPEWHQPLYQDISQERYLDLLREYDFFCVVRNPYERCISEFYCSWEDGSPQKNVSLDEFNSFIQKRILENRISTHWAPQSLFIFHQGKQIIKHVLHYENLQEEFAKLMNLYNLPIHLDRYENVSPRKTYTIKDFSPRTIQMINEFYSDDFQNFGYSRLQENEKMD